MIEEIKKIKVQLKDLEKMISETKERLPAHSVKPPVMIELLDLEDQYDELFKKLTTLTNNEKS